jgi:hypothetical protein
MIIEKQKKTTTQKTKQENQLVGEKMNSIVVETNNQSNQ